MQTLQITDILDTRQRALVERREWHIKRNQVEGAQRCTSRLDELAEIRALMALSPTGIPA